MRLPTIIGTAAFPGAVRVALVLDLCGHRAGRPQALSAHGAGHRVLRLGAHLPAGLALMSCPSCPGGVAAVSAAAGFIAIPGMAPWSMPMSAIVSTGRGRRAGTSAVIPSRVASVPRA